MIRILILNDDPNLNPHYLSLFPQEEAETDIVLVNGPLETVPTLTLPSKNYDVVLSFLMLMHPESLESLDLRKRIDKDLPIIIVVDKLKLQLLGDSETKIVEQFIDRNEPLFILDSATNTMSQIKEKVKDVTTYK